jgi:hypothetical protein
MLLEIGSVKGGMKMRVGTALSDDGTEDDGGPFDSVFVTSRDSSMLFM